MRYAAALISVLATLLAAGCNKNRIPEPKTASEPGAAVSSNRSVALPEPAQANNHSVLETTPGHKQ